MPESDDSHSNDHANNANNSNHSNMPYMTYSFSVFDLSGNIIDNSSNPYFLIDASYNLLDLSMNILYNMNDIIDLSNVTINGIGYKIEHNISTDPSGNINQHTMFTSTQPDIYDPNINEDLIQYVSTYDDTADANSENAVIMNQIADYASKIKCENFHGKGTIDDYAELFKAASKIATETKQIQLDIDVDGFNEFGQAADDLANLFTNFTIRLQNINIINDTTFLKAVVSALEKIYNLSNVFGKFKETIMCKSSIQLPKSSHDTKVILDNVMDEVNCAMKYIGNFVEVTDPNLHDAALSADEKNIISKAVDTIDNWNAICNEGVSIAMNTNPDIISINNTNETLKTKTVQLKTLSANLKNKFYFYMK